MKNNQGFTLLEVLLAITIFALVSSMVGYAVRTAVLTLEVTGNRKEIIRQAGIAMERIRKDLAGVQGGMVFIGESREIEDSPADTLRFYSSAHLDFSSSPQTPAIAEIRYEVVGSGDEQAVQSLIRYDTEALPGVEGEENEGTGYVLCERLTAVSFTYMDQDSQKTDTWEAGPVEEEGDEVLPLPEIVYVSLDFLLDEEEQSTMRFATAVRLPDVAEGTGADE